MEVQKKKYNEVDEWDAMMCVREDVRKQEVYRKSESALNEWSDAMRNCGKVSSRGM